MSVFSKAGAGLLIIIVKAILQHYNIAVPDGSVELAFDNLFDLIGWFLLIWGQLDRKDLFFGVFRRGDNS